jgi:GNAT superfamily N-acetyltransferase
MTAVISIRQGLPTELSVLTSIDDDSCQLYAASGVVLALDAAHPFAVAEQSRWSAALARRSTFIAEDAAGRALGFACCGFVDGEPYLDQLSVRLERMKQGLGTLLLREAVAWAEGEGGRALWLTTYGHLPFNRAMYERRGFSLAAERDCPREVLHHLDQQRRWLPFPEQRVAMRRPLA